MRFLFLMITALLSTHMVLAAAGATHEYQLKNGLHLVVREDHRAPVVMVQVWYKVGSSYEPNGITGISHLLEHMMFDGTQQYPDGSFSQIVLKEGGELNASTTTDYTNYYVEISKKHLPLILQLEADRMQNLTLTPKQFNKEIKVVREERRLRVDDNPQALTFERHNAAAFISNPYHHPIIGWMKDLNHITLDDIKQWYRTWYTPNNAIIVIVGDVDPKQTLAQVKNIFEAIPARSVTTPKAGNEQRPLGTKKVVVKLPAKLPMLIMAFNVPVKKTAPNSLDPYALDVLSNILTSGDSARLKKDLIRHQQVATDIQTDYAIFSLFSNLFSFIGIPSQNHSNQELQDAVFKTIDSLKTEPITQEELQKNINQLIAKKTYAKDDISYQAFEIGALESVNLSWKEADDYFTKVRQVTPEQLQAVAKKYLTKENLTITTLEPLALEHGGASHEKN